MIGAPVVFCGAVQVGFCAVAEENVPPAPLSLQDQANPVCPRLSVACMVSETEPPEATGFGLPEAVTVTVWVEVVCGCTVKKAVPVLVSEGEPLHVAVAVSVTVTLLPVVFTDAV